MIPAKKAAGITTLLCLSFVLPALVLFAAGCSGGEDGDTGEDVAESPGGDVVKTGSVVSVQYRGTLPDSTVFDQSSPGKPLVFEAGAGRVIPGFDNAVLGMKVGEEKTVTIPPDEGYGPTNPNMVVNVARSSFSEDADPKPGEEITIRNAAGRTLKGVLISASADSFLIDFNHPLAGKEITFDIKVVDIR